MKNIKEYLNEGLIKRQAGMDMRTKIEAWLKEYNIRNYTINDDLTIDVKGHVVLEGYTEKHLPDYIQFGKVVGFFTINESPNLETLKGCPKEVGIDFYCYNCKNLESLKGSPKIVGGNFSCRKCSKLESLENCPKEVGRDFVCSNCGKQFTEDDVKKVCKVKKRIFV